MSNQPTKPTVITKEYLDSFAHRLPTNMKRVNDKLYITITDEIFCKLFWIKFIKDRLAPALSAQNRVLQINEIDLSLPVYIDAKTNELRHLPKLMSGALFFADQLTVPNTVSGVDFSGNRILVVALVLLTLACLLCIVFRDRSWSEIF